MLCYYHNNSESIFDVHCWYKNLILCKDRQRVSLKLGRMKKGKDISYSSSLDNKYISFNKIGKCFTAEQFWKYFFGAHYWYK